jgi:hypothetical protein
MPQSFTPFPPRHKRPASRPLADLVGASLGPALARHGFGEAEVLLHWNEIVGADLADRCQPVRMQWRPRRAGPDASIEPATLVVRVDSAWALTLQHMEPVVVERLNVFLGWRCVGRLALRQGPVATRARPPRRAPPPDPACVKAAARAVTEIDDEALRAVLTRLGARVLQRRGSQEI